MPSDVFNVSVGTGSGIVPSRKRFLLRLEDEIRCVCHVGIMAIFRPVLCTPTHTTPKCEKQICHRPEQTRIGSRGLKAFQPICTAYDAVHRQQTRR